MLPDYSLVIPVLDEKNNPHLAGLLLSLARQSHPPREIHLVVGDNRQGRAINYGVSRACTPYVGTVDDDTQIDDPGLFAKIIRAMEADGTIGMGGAACEIPVSATPFQQQAMRQIPRRHFPVTREHVDSDMVQHPCLMMPRALFTAIGGEDESIIRGLDPVLRKKVRDAGRRVVVIADTYVYHLLPGSLRKLARMYFRNGRGSAFARRHHPERILELTDGHDRGKFVEKRSLGYRACRRMYHFLRALVGLRFIRVVVDAAYMLGFTYESLFRSYQAQAKTIVRMDTETRHDGGMVTYWHRGVYK
jgi:glycosyltransferase involved in cell wall biosynthesis